MNIRLALLWNTWSRARGQDLTTCEGLAHGCGYSYKGLKLALTFPWIVENTWNTMAHAEVFSSLNLQTGSCPWTEAEFNVQQINFLDSLIVKNLTENLTHHRQFVKTRRWDMSVWHLLMLCLKKSNLSSVSKNMPDDVISGVKVKYHAFNNITTAESIWIKKKHLVWMLDKFRFYLIAFLQDINV